jgi:hypothetical protein
MGCLCCGAIAELGALCGACAEEITPCEGLIPDHLRSRVAPTAAKAWLIDGFGGAHAIGSRSTIGRDHDRDFVVLAGSVSREHAELTCDGARSTVRDLGSRNGTFVNGTRVREQVELPPRARLEIGEVALWFLVEPVPRPPRRATMTTANAGAGLVRYELQCGAIELCVVAGDDAVGGGALLWRPAGTESWSERSLAPLEFQLLRALCLHAYDEVSSPSPVRGCVATRQLVQDLPFLSKFANQENVRQIVLRLRGVLTEVGARGILAVAPGRGYYLACTVTSPGAAGPAGARRRRAATQP